jgi:hypothetical protein
MLRAQERKRAGGPVRYRCAVLVLGLVLVTTACGGRGRKAGATVTVTVPASTGTTAGEPPPPPPPKQATVVVQASGFSQDGSDASYGVVLRNTSPTQDALDVEVTTNFDDASGTILDTESETISVIPAHTTYYLGGDGSLESSARVVRLEVNPTVGQSAHTNYPLPIVSRVGLTRDLYLGLTVHGQVENNLDAPLSQFAQITTVIFSPSGRVVGGGFTYLDADLPPGRSAAWSTNITATPHSAGYARASMENSIVGGE